MRLSASIRTVSRLLLVLLLVVGSAALVGSSKRPYTIHDKAYFADEAIVDFVRPGLTITINSAKITTAGAISVTYTLTDPMGLPLDKGGVTTPGAVSLSYIAATIPKGQEQYVTYTTRQATGAVLGTVTQAASESNGTTSQVGAGQYQYAFKTEAPDGFDSTATHTIAVYGSRNLTEFNFGTSYASATFNFVPNGAKVTVTRDVIRTESCNTCHDQLAFHGGSRIGMNMCVLCHTPQTSDPDSGNTVDLKVMAHKIHMGSQLPSVIGSATTPGVPYQIIGFQNAVTDFSTVVDPADPRRCEVCHSQTTGAAQATAFMIKPSRVACGSCHDDVNFASGANHPGGFQSDDHQCANCHVPKGESDFDASILGAHVVPTESSLLAGLNLAITSVSNTLAGQSPVVKFTVQDNKANNIPLSKVATLQFTMAGPTTDYGYTSFGADTAGTPGYVTESALKAPCDSSGDCTYTFTHAIPAAATGTYSIGGEARNSETLLAGTNAEHAVQNGAKNPVVNFSVDGSAVQPRRTVVALSNCNNCHVSLALHGGLRNQIEMCVLCHNPSNTDASVRGDAVVAADKALPPQGINFALLVHRIHDGVNVTANGGQPFIVVGHNGSHNDFSDVLYPAMSPQGEATDLKNCSMCHVDGSEQTLPTTLNQVTDPQGWINPTVGPDSSACSGCHVSKPAASHFLSNANSLGESCDVCHSAGAQFAVDAVHVQ